MIKVELSKEDWQRLLNAAALAPYAQIAPTLERLAAQLQSPKEEKPPQDQA